MSTVIAPLIQSRVTGRPAPKPQNLWIEVKVDPNGDATFDTQMEERIGQGILRHVILRANADCTIVFTNPTLFGLTTDNVHLQEGIPRVLVIGDHVGIDHSVETHYYVRPPMRMDRDKGDPKIVVP